MAQSSEQHSRLGYYFAGMSATSIAAPNIMIIVTIAIYIGWPACNALLILTLGILGGLIGWLSLALVAQYFTTINRANPSVYRELRSRFNILEIQIDSTDSLFRRVREIGEYSQTYEDRLHSARAEAFTYLTSLKRALDDTEYDRDSTSWGPPRGISPGSGSAPVAP